MKLKPPSNNTPAPLPAGKYKVRIGTAERRTSQKKNVYVYFRFDIVEGAYAGRYVISTIIIDSLTYWMKQKGKQQWIELTNALDERFVKIDELTGRELVIDVVNKDRDGRVFPEVKKYCLPETALEVVERAKKDGNTGSASSW